MKDECRILLELNEEELQVLKKQYTVCIANILASQLSLDGINQLVEKLRQNN